MYIARRLAQPNGGKLEWMSLGWETQPLIRVENLVKYYGELAAVDRVSFRVARGEVVGFLGPNGAGKTTTMRLITGFLPPTDGSVAVAGCDTIEDPIAARRAVGYLPEAPPLYPEMRVNDYLAFTAAIKDVPRKQRGVRVDQTLAACGLAEVARRVISTLSKGYRQRVGIAQAIVHEPEVLVLDEPTAGLDPVQVVEIRHLIRELADVEHRTVILSTHILPEVESICQRVLLISEGRIRVDGPLDEVRGGATLEEVFLREVGAGAGATPSAPAPTEAPSTDPSPGAPPA